MVVTFFKSRSYCARAPAICSVRIALQTYYSPPPCPWAYDRFLPETGDHLGSMIEATNAEPSGCRSCFWKGWNGSV